MWICKGIVPLWIACEPKHITMKKSIILVLIAAVMGAFQEAKPRYFSSSPEIDEVKALINDYENGNWEGWISHYADTAKVAHNIVQGISPGEAREGLKEPNIYVGLYIWKLSYLL